jgi:hypothetical protein
MLKMISLISGHWKQSSFEVKKKLLLIDSIRTMISLR